MSAASPLDAQLAEFCDRYPVSEIRHAGEAWCYRRGGAGAAPVLWLTGALGIARTAFRQILALGPDCRILAPDYPPVRSLERMTDGLVAILDAEGVASTHIVGGSFGGMLAQHLVRRHPGRVRSLVLSQTAAPEPRRARRSLDRAIARSVGLWPEPLVRLLFRRRLRGGFAVGDPFWLRLFESTVAGLTKSDMISRARLVAEFAEQDYRPGDVDGWPGRVLIVEADDDPLMPAATRAALRALYPRADVHCFSGTGHSAAILDPERYVEVLRRFLVEANAATP